LIEPTVYDFRASDGYVWKYRRYEAPSTPVGTVVTLHGIQSHGGVDGRIDRAGG
jgi:alpha-beta hydrolase superfamily lysophospholipase